MQACNCEPRVLGCILLGCVVLIWVVSSFVVQEVLSMHGGGPFFLTWFANSLFTLNLPAVLLCCWTHRPTALATPAEVDIESANSADSSDDAHQTVVHPGDAQPLLVEPSSTADSEPADKSCSASLKITLWNRELFNASLVVAPLWFMANFLYNASLQNTSVSSNTVISSLSGCFTFMIAYATNREMFSWAKLGGILLSFAGACLTTLSDAERVAPASHGVNVSESAIAGMVLSPSQAPQSHERFWGDAICFVSAIFYALYTTQIERRVPSSEAKNLMLFFGYIGSLGMVCLFPVVLILNFTGIEDVTALHQKALLLIAAKGLFDNVLSDNLWAKAIKLTSPTIATIALGLTIPFSILADYTLGTAGLDAYSVCGALSMLVGFVLVNLGHRPASSVASPA